jgi:hypothetical protein
MSRHTLYLARLIGLFALLLVAGLLAHPGASIAAVSRTIGNPSMVLLYAMVSLGGGLAIVLAHNVWSGGALPVVVTVVGWLMLAKGLLLLVLTPNALTRMFELLQYGEYFYLSLVPALVAGLYLTWAGFAARPQSGGAA